MIKVVILGAGNVGNHLCNAFNAASNVEVLQVYNRSESAFKDLPKDIATTNKLSNLKQADVYIIALPDDAIASFSEKLPPNIGLVVHTSGGVSMEALSEVNKRGVFYPLQTFSKSTEVEFGDIPICVEAESKTDLELLINLGISVSRSVSEINSEQRTKLHLAAVVVNNFVNHLYYISESYLGQHNIPFDLLKPLIAETARKIQVVAPSEAQTGPAKRSDSETIKKHLNLLPEGTFKTLYQQLTEAISQTHGKKL